jgi:site-specific recombinase XerD
VPITWQPSYEASRARFHDLRHTFASHFIVRGGYPADLKEVLGHADIKTTMRYAHLSTQHLRSSMERMEGLASGLMPFC